eukprot:jgi/Orpsp1_1/1181474/evm.model.c7180000077307.1
MNANSIIDSYQNQNNEQNNNVNYINTNTYNNEANTNTYLNQDNNIQNELNQNNANSIVNTPINNSNSNIQQTEVPQTSQQPQAIPEAIPEATQKTEGSSATAYLLGGVGFTSVAFIAFFGYNNYRQNAEFNRIKEEFLTEKSTIAKPEKAKNTNSLTRLSRSLSLSFINKDDDFIDNKPVVSESINAGNYSLTKNRAYKCHVAWTPLVSDEIILRRGDLVCVKESYNDGYSLGRNLSTKFDGIFPTCCLASPKDQIMGSELIKNGKFVSILKRSSSKNKAKRTRRASSVSAVLPSWVQKTELNSILTQ